GFIFTTALPPGLCAAATASIRHLKESQVEREMHQRQAARAKEILGGAGLPVMESETHIVPILVGDAERCKKASDILLEYHDIYIQPINYPTVPRGTERLRITPSPFHTDDMIEGLKEALIKVWEVLDLPFEKPKLKPAPVQKDGLEVFPAAGG
ncbi:MAG: aminotransferase class I/II-fold pyridoxal phosphate-dependent enzyme, partial [Hyphomicrobiales bacterium]|nr:aminotransferase class I/II-fold pyridoxal phosphate-dependent enzyme [Hyphomicrobiales bacterium]